MRKSYLLLAGAGAVVLAACSGDKNTSINDDLKKDLELASSSDGITLANSSMMAGQQVVSAIEQTAPAPKKKAPSTTVKRHKPAPKATPRVVETQALASTNDMDEQTVAPEPVYNDPMPVSPRPQPIPVSYPGGASSGNGGRVGGGSGAGAVLGTILGAVIRGGTVGDVDRCDPRHDGRGGAVISINRFPLPGRIGGVVRSGGVSSSRPPIGRTR